MIFPQIATDRPFPGGGTIPLGGGTAISGGGTPDTGVERRSGPFRLNLTTAETPKSSG